jgi:hypothetical protein
VNRSIKVYKVIYPFAIMVTLTYAIQYTYFPGVILAYPVSFIHEFKWFAIGAITI